MTPYQFLEGRAGARFSASGRLPPVAPELQDVVFGMIVGAVRKISSYAGQDFHLMPDSST